MATKKSTAKDMTTMEALTVAGAYPGADPLQHGRKVVGPRNALSLGLVTRFDAEAPPPAPRSSGEIAKKWNSLSPGARQAQFGANPHLIGHKWEELTEGEKRNVLGMDLQATASPQVKAAAGDDLRRPRVPKHPAPDAEEERDAGLETGGTIPVPTGPKPGTVPHGSSDAKEGPLRAQPALPPGGRTGMPRTRSARKAKDTPGDLTGQESLPLSTTTVAQAGRKLEGQRDEKPVATTQDEVAEKFFSAFGVQSSFGQRRG